MSSKSQVLSAALVASMSPETDVTPPSRARAFSFASAVAAMQVGDMPVSRVQKISGEHSIEQASAVISEQTDKLRASVGSSVSQAKRRIQGADYSIETGSILMKSGVYIIALVHRTA